MNPEKHTSICFIVVTVWLSIRMVPTCWTSLCVWARYQLQVCISATRIRLGYVSHQPKYCIRQQAPVQCNMYLTKQNTAPSTTHPWYMYLTSTISPTRNGYHTQRRPTPSVGSALNRCVLTQWRGERSFVRILHTYVLEYPYCIMCQKVALKV